MTVFEISKSEAILSYFCRSFSICRRKYTVNTSRKRTKFFRNRFPGFPSHDDCIFPMWFFSTTRKSTKKIHIFFDIPSESSIFSDSILVVYCNDQSKFFEFHSLIILFHNRKYILLLSIFLLFPGNSFYLPVFYR